MNWKLESNREFINPKTELSWLGWRATAIDLMRSGWEIGSIFNPGYREMHITLRNRSLNLVGISEQGYLEIAWRHFVDTRWMNHLDYQINPHYLDKIMGHSTLINMRIAREINVYLSDLYAAEASYQTMDAALVSPTGEIHKLTSFFHDSQPDEIVVETRPDVIALLNQIKDMQAPKAKELLAKQRLTGETKNLRETVKILTFANAA